MMRAEARLPSVGDLMAGKYRLLSVIGRGGMGVVFEAQHELLDRRVAIKVLAPEAVDSTEAVTRFMNEARAVARIRSDLVVQVLDVGTLDDGLPYMVMERLDGIDLGKLLEQHGWLGVPEAVDLLMEAIEGVSHAHLEGIIHRDLKPSNLFLARRPDGSTVVKVLDFGISKLTDADRPSGSITATNAVIGSPLYMSPEQLRSSKTIDARADIWSLGVIAYQILTHTLPFAGDNLVAIFAAIQETDAPPLARTRRDIPSALDEAVCRCLRRAPGERFATVFHLAQAIAPFGGKRAHDSLDRLGVRLASRGLAFDGATAASGHVDGRAISGMAQTLRAPLTDAGAPSVDPRSMRAGTLDAPSEREATALPWANTGGVRSPRAPGRAVVAASATTIAFLVAAVVASRAHPPSSAPSAGTDPTPDSAAPAREAPSAAAPFAVAPVPIPVPPSSTPDASVSIVPAPLSSPKPVSKGTRGTKWVPPHPSPPPSTTPRAPEPPPAPSATNPIDMSPVR